MWTEQSNAFCTAFNIDAPIIQAPMAGGPSTPELVSAVSEAGGLGSIPTGYMKPDILEAEIHRAKSGTTKPFSANLFIPPADAPSAKIGDDAKAELLAIAGDLEIDYVNFTPDVDASIEALVDILIKEDVPVVSFTFGILAADTIQRFKAAGTQLVGTATCVEEGRLLQNAGCDAIVAQGYEAGGHRGSFSPDAAQPVGLMALVPQLVDAVDIPVIASGAIMDGRTIAAALTLGASAVQMGTAFLTCTESGATPAWKNYIGISHDTSTVLTKTFSGKHARGIRNEFIYRMTPHEDALPDYPIQNAITGNLRATAKGKRDPEYQSLWAGQATQLCRPMPAKELMATLIEETDQAFNHR